VNVRNKLAHGEWRDVHLTEYLELHEKIDEMMNWICEDLETSAAQRSYLRGR
jgi:hypothetical protein